MAQWREHHTAHSSSFAYQIGATVTDLTSGTWTPVTALNFTGPIATSTASALDGNASENRVAISASFAVSIAPNQEIVLRWSDPDDSGNDHGLAIDDLTVTATATDAAPTVSATIPSNDATGVAVDADISVTFSEAVIVSGDWLQIICSASGTRNVVDTVVTSGSTTFTINPNNDFTEGETCEVTIYAAQVSDQDGTPDTMETNYSWSFTIVEATTGCTELFFSEYVEGSSFNKAVEIYNGSATTVALDAYTVELYSNGSSLPSNSMPLSGNLAPDAVYVIAHDSASTAILTSLMPQQ